MARKSLIGVLGSLSRPSLKLLVLRDGYQLDQDEELVIVHLQELNTRYLLHNQALVKERQALQKRLAEIEGKRKDQNKLISDLQQQVNDLKGQLRDLHQASMEMLQRFELMMRVQSLEVEQMKQRARLRAQLRGQASLLRLSTTSKPLFVKPPKPVSGRAQLLLTSPTQEEQQCSQASSPMAVSPTHGKRTTTQPARRLDIDTAPSPVRFGSDAVILMEVLSHFSALTPKRQLTPPRQAHEMGSPQQRPRLNQSVSLTSFLGSRQIIQSLLNSMAPPEQLQATLPAPNKSADTTSTDTKPPLDSAKGSATTDRRPHRRRTKPVNYAPVPLLAKLRRSSLLRFVDAVGENAFEYVISTLGTTTTGKRSGSVAPETVTDTTTSKSIVSRERESQLPAITVEAQQYPEGKNKVGSRATAKTAPALIDCDRVEPESQQLPDRVSDDPEWAPEDAAPAKRKTRRPNKRPALANVTNTAQLAAASPRAKRTRVARSEPDPFAFEE